MKECTQTDKPKKTTRCRVLLCISLFLLFAFLISVYISNACIKLTFIKLESEKVQSNVRIAVISDLHSKEFANNNEKLYKKIKDCNPDLILTVGDMISDKHTDSQGINYLREVLSQLCTIAPVYCSFGNHERHSPEFEIIRESMEQSGAIILEKTYEDVVVHNNTIRLLGISYYLSWDYEANAFLSDSLQTTSSSTFSLLLCHNPEFYQWGIKNYSIDLTVSGHTHGGMLKLPVIGPVYVPEQRWFPQYGAGLYKEQNGCLAVTTGLGSSPEYMPRIFNRPEIMIIDVI